MAALILLVPLAATSTHGAIRKLGARRWQRLHRLAYPAALLIAVHFILRVKGFQWEPWIYAGIAGALLAMRIRTGPSRP
jgi:sulfoxide reductase heme-binding subunit YedZ